jgi:hypothetical protein
VRLVQVEQGELLVNVPVVNICLANNRNFDFHYRHFEPGGGDNEARGSNEPGRRPCEFEPAGRRMNPYHLPKSNKFGPKQILIRPT